MARTTNTIRFNRLALACLMFTAASPAWAQSSPANAASPSADATPDQSAKPGRKGEIKDLGTVMVTASKREVNQRDLAGSVSVVQGDELENLGAQDQEDLFKLTPGVQFNKAEPNRALPTIRGVGTVTSSSSLGQQQGTTGIYIEDVPFTDPFGFVATADIAPFDLERVEVLRGPQGALFGSASLGGAVRYLFQRPSTDRTEFSVLTELNSVSNGGTGFSLHAMGNLPLSPNAAIRVVAFDRQDSGYIDNLGTGRDAANDLHQSGGRIMGLFTPTDALTIRATVLQQRTKTDDDSGISQDPDELVINTPTASTRDSTLTFANLQVDYALEGAVLSSNSGWIDKSNDNVVDSTLTAGGVGGLIAPFLPALSPVISAGSVDGSTFSQEFRITSTGSGPFTWLGGVFYQRSKYDGGSAFMAPGGAAAWGDFGFLLPGDVILSEYSKAVATERAVFADAGFDFGNGVSIGLGGRYYRTAADYDIVATTFGSPLLVKQGMSESGFTPKADIKYTFGDNMVYALVSKGYRFGGINAASGTPYDSDSLWNYEAGLRLAPADNLTLDITGFLLDWSDAQVNAAIPGTVPFNGIANVGKAKVTGLELAAHWRATQSLLFDAGLAYTDATIDTEFLSSSGIVVPDGTRLPGTAKLQTNLAASYWFTGPMASDGRFMVNHHHVGDRMVRLEGNEKLDAYDLLDARVAFQKGQWELGLFVNNITDKRAAVGGGFSPGLGSPDRVNYFLIKPRTYGISLRYDL